VPDEAALLLQSRDLFVRRPLRRDMLRQAIARLSRHITGTLAEPPGFLGDDRHPLLRRELIRIRVRIVASDKGRRHVALATQRPDEKPLYVRRPLHHLVDQPADYVYTRLKHRDRTCSARRLHWLRTAEIGI